MPDHHYAEHLQHVLLPVHNPLQNQYVLLYNLDQLNVFTQ
jgi:hypothetical protein